MQCPRIPRPLSQGSWSDCLPHMWNQNIYSPPRMLQQLGIYLPPPPHSITMDNHPLTPNTMADRSNGRADWRGTAGARESVHPVIQRWSLIHRGLRAKASVTRDQLCHTVPNSGTSVNITFHWRFTAWHTAGHEASLIPNRDVCVCLDPHCYWLNLRRNQLHSSASGLYWAPCLFTHAY